MTNWGFIYGAGAWEVKSCVQAETFDDALNQIKKNIHQRFSKAPVEESLSEYLYRIQRLPDHVTPQEWMNSFTPPEKRVALPPESPAEARVRRSGNFKDVVLDLFDLIMAEAADREEDEIK